MSRTPAIRELENTILANGYGGWIYCDSCGKNIGYLCYVTYDYFRFAYKCNCGGCGSMRIAFGDSLCSSDGSSPDSPKETDIDSVAVTSNSALVTIKNRLCCQADQSPLFTVLEKNLESYQYEVICNTCNTKYTGGKFEK